MRRAPAVTIALAALTFTGCGPTVYERAVDACAGRNVQANERALQRDHYLAPGAHVRCGSQVPTRTGRSE